MTQSYRVKTKYNNKCKSSIINVNNKCKSSIINVNNKYKSSNRRRLERYPLPVRDTNRTGAEVILLLPQAAVYNKPHSSNHKVVINHKKNFSKCQFKK